MAEDKQKQAGTAEQQAGMDEAAVPPAEEREPVAGAGSGGEEDAADAVEGGVEPEDDVARLQAEVAQAREMALRAQAEAQNTMRRAEQDVEKARKFALERFTSELLPVVDNLERALEAAAGDDSPTSSSIAEGVELTLKSFLEAMRKFNIEVVDPAGEPFDPNLHQAMSMVENDEVEPNTVTAVMQKGYTLSGRLVRPAMVMVSKGRREA